MARGVDKTFDGSMAEEIRAALIAAATAAYEDAGFAGLCAEGRWENAISAMRSLKLGQPTTKPESGGHQP